jgi:hydroxypyruvate isomerase
MDHFATASTGPTKKQLNESRAAVAAAQGVAESKWNYPPEYTKKANADDEDELKVSLINKDARKAWRKKQKAKAHKDLMTGKKKEPGVAEGAIDNLEARRIEDLNRLMDEILTRFRTEKLPAQYRDALKQRLEKLKAERNSYYHART